MKVLKISLLLLFLCTGYSAFSQSVEAKQKLNELQQSFTKNNFDAQQKVSFSNGNLIFENLIRNQKQSIPVANVLVSEIKFANFVTATALFYNEVEMKIKKNTSIEINKFSFLTENEQEGKKIQNQIKELIELLQK